jgi:hypothetical protein
LPTAAAACAAFRQSHLVLRFFCFLLFWFWFFFFGGQNPPNLKLGKEGDQPTTSPHLLWPSPSAAETFYRLFGGHHHWHFTEQKLSKTCARTILIMLTKEPIVLEPI